MSVSCGIIGRPSVGKTELFNLLTGRASQGEITTGTAAIPDVRLDFLARIYNPKKVTHAGIEMVDIPGLNLSDRNTNNTQRKFLEAVRKVDALVHVVRAFADESVWHVDGRVDVKRDLDIINTELIFHDLELVETRIERIEEMRKKGLRDNEAELAALLKCREVLEDEKPLDMGVFSEHERENLRHIEFLTSKPVIIALNVDADQLETLDYPGRADVFSWAEAMGHKVFEIAVELEKEIKELEAEEQEAFLLALGIEEPSMAKLARAVYSRLGLISFLTVGKDEVRAWTIREGTKAKQAAGKVHTDIERGFIRAEVISFEDFSACGTEKTAKEKGLYRLEGKDYQVRDGDIINFRFNV